MRSALCLCWWLFVGLSFYQSAAADWTRIATYNLHNYLVMDRHVAGVWRPAYPKPEAEKAMLREVIAAARPDILLLQEIGEAPFLAELRADLALDGHEYPCAIHMRGADAVRHLAVLSKRPPCTVVKHQDLSFNYLGRREYVRRGMLELGFSRANGQPFKLFAVHLKSRWTDEAADPESQLRRTREAQACRDRIIQRTFECGVFDFVIAGDFNDHPDSATMRRFYRRGALQLGSLVPAWDSRQEVWTYFYPKQAEYGLVDGFVISPRLAPALEAGHGTVVDLAGALRGSDHRMVYIDVCLGLAAPTSAAKQ